MLASFALLVRSFQDVTIRLIAQNGILGGKVADAARQRSFFRRARPSFGATMKSMVHKTVGRSMTTLFEDPGRAGELYL